MNKKIRTVGLITLLLISFVLLFSFLFKINTFYQSYLLTTNNQQMLQVKKDNNSFYENQKIIIKVNDSSFKVTIKTVYDDFNYFYLVISKQIYENQKQNIIWIYNEKISIAKYIIKQLF